MAKQAAQLAAGCQPLGIGLAARWIVGGIGLPLAAAAHPVVIERDDAAGGTQTSEHLVGDDPRQPGRKRPIARQSAEPDIGPHVGLLQHVLGFGIVLSRLRVRRNRRRLWRRMISSKASASPARVLAASSASLGAGVARSAGSGTGAATGGAPRRS